MTTVTTQPSILELSCDFERPCSWNNTATSFNWMIIKPSSSSSTYKPNVDHTLNSESGSLITPNVSSSLSANSIASYSSPFTSGQKCIEFYYYMYGPQVTKKFNL